MRYQEIQILYEDKDIIVCVKPAGMPVQSDKTGAYDLTSGLLNHLTEERNRKEAGKAAKGGKNPAHREQPPYLAVIHRLDRPVGGVMVFAKTRNVAANLSRQVQERRMTKRYYCVLTGFKGSYEESNGMSQKCSAQTSGWQTQADYLAVDKRTNLARFADEKDKDARQAVLNWRPLEQQEQSGEVLAEVELLTGRHHQIRLQMTRLAQGIWGDTKYNPEFREKKGWHELALFSHELLFLHPSDGKPMSFQAVPEGTVFQNFSYIQRLRER